MILPGGQQSSIGEGALVKEIGMVAVVTMEEGQHGEGIDGTTGNEVVAQSFSEYATWASSAWASA